MFDLWADAGDRIESTRAPGMAAQETTRREGASLEDAVDLDGLRGVVRARRLEAAGRRHEGRDEPLVAADDLGE
jgi:hypothetical protein